FSYIRTAGFEGAPYKLPIYCNDKIVLVELCRQLDVLHRTCRDKKISGIQFPITLGNYTCRSTQDAQNIERTISELNFHSYQKRTSFDSKSFISKNLRMTYYHLPAFEDYWDDYVDEYEVRKIMFGRLSLQKIKDFKLYTVHEGMIDD
ncbi:hypothetical protein KI387_040182, partial [Taxus chinensis]